MIDFENRPLSKEKLVEIFIYFSLSLSSQFQIAFIDLSYFVLI